MARISKYDFDEKVTSEDFLIGSDGFTKKTRNYRVSDLVGFLGTQDPVLGDKFAYTYNNNPNFNRLQQGEISFNNRVDVNTEFADITNIYINRYNSFGIDVFEYLNKIKDYDAVLNLVVSNNSVNTGVFVIQNVAIYNGDVLVLDVDMRLENGFMNNGDIILISSSYKVLNSNYTHRQIAVSTTWSIQHNLNKFPSVTIVDDNDNVIHADIQYTNENLLTITFTGATSGKAYLN